MKKVEFKVSVHVSISIFVVDDSLTGLLQLNHPSIFLFTAIKFRVFLLLRMAVILVIVAILVIDVKWVVT